MPAPDVKVLFGRRVRQLRTEKGISQEAFAASINLDRSYYGSVERGERNISLENIVVIADGLGIPPCELLRFEAVNGPAGKSGDGRRKPRSQKPAKSN